MSTGPTPAFEFRTDDADVDPGSHVVLGLANPGVVGLTAVSHLVEKLETTQIGHVRNRGLPDITPFSEGTPRFPSRLYAVPDADATFLVSEVFLPVSVSELFVDGLLSFVDANDIDELTVVHGVPFPHGPDEHAVFAVGTDEYHRRRIEGTEIRPLRGGFFDGVVGELLTRGLEREGLAVGALVTPAHPPGPDFDGALLTLSALESVYGLTVDRTELEQRSEEMRRYYEQLAERMRTLEESDVDPRMREYPDDRMYM